jgi:hypothetical protein
MLSTPEYAAREQIDASLVAADWSYRITRPSILAWRIGYAPFNQRGGLGKARLLQFIESGRLDRELFEKILARHLLEQSWNKFQLQFLDDTP